MVFLENNIPTAQLDRCFFSQSLRTKLSRDALTEFPFLLQSMMIYKINDL
jgi:hypothetical protein